MVVILLGPPGVGKGTQGALLEEALDAERLATGDLLREARREGTRLGKMAQEYMDRGELVPDQVILDMVREKLESLPTTRNVIFDGFPRTEAQAEGLNRMLPELDRSVDAVVLLEASEEVLVKRISGRRTSPSGRVYNVYFDPPEQEGVCDDCGEPLEHREDDQPETVRRRLEVYREQTEPLIEFYEESSAPLHRIDGEGEVDEVQDRILESLGAGAA